MTNPFRCPDCRGLKRPWYRHCFDCTMLAAFAAIREGIEILEIRRAFARAVLKRAIEREDGSS